MLVVGDQGQAILSVGYIPERLYEVPLDDVNNKWQLQQKLKCVLGYGRGYASDLPVDNHFGWIQLSILKAFRSSSKMG